MFDRREFIKFPILGAFYRRGGQSFCYFFCCQKKQKERCGWMSPSGHFTDVKCLQARLAILAFRLRSNSDMAAPWGWQDALFAFAPL